MQRATINRTRSRNWKKKREKARNGNFRSSVCDSTIWEQVSFAGNLDAASHARAMKGNLDDSRSTLLLARNREEKGNCGFRGKIRGKRESTNACQSFRSESLLEYLTSSVSLPRVEFFFARRNLSLDRVITTTFPTRAVHFVASLHPLVTSSRRRKNISWYRLREVCSTYSTSFRRRR